VTDGFGYLFKDRGCSGAVWEYLPVHKCRACIGLADDGCNLMQPVTDGRLVAPHALDLLLQPLVGQHSGKHGFFSDLASTLGIPSTLSSMAWQGIRVRSVQIAPWFIRSVDWPSTRIW
jgi:hypothetical protein